MANLPSQSPFAITETDRITVRRPDGTVVREYLNARVRPNEIQISDTLVPIHVNDIIERTLPSGIVETFLVLDPGYQNSPIPGRSMDRYLVKYRRTDAPPRPARGVTFNNPSFSGNSRVNLSSVDNSSNTIGATSGDVAEIFAAARAAIENVTSSTDRQRLTTEITTLENSYNTPSFADQYVRFVGAVADHLTIFAPLLTALATLHMH